MRNETEKDYKEGLAFWGRISELMDKQCLSADEFCRKTQINLHTFKGWKLRKFIPGAKETVRMAYNLNTTPEYLLFGEGGNIQIVKAIFWLKQVQNPDDLEMIVEIIRGQVEFWNKKRSS